MGEDVVVYNLAQITGNSQQDLFLKYIPIVSPAIILLVFIIGQFFDSYKRRKEARRAWYYKVHLEPSIVDLNSFFSTIDAIYSETVKPLRDSSDENSKAFVREIMKIKKNVSEEKRNFEENTVLMIQPQYPKIFAKITELLNSFQDGFYELVEGGKTTGSGLDYTSLRNMHKRDILHYLSKPAI